jgi:hypothetical protein
VNRDEMTVRLRRFHKSRVANWIGGLGALGGFLALVLVLWQRVHGGRGLDHYIAMSGYEWSPLIALITVVIASLVLVVGGSLRWLVEQREERSFLATVRQRIAARHQRRTGKPCTGGREQGAAEQ